MAAGTPARKTSNRNAQVAHTVAPKATKEVVAVGCKYPHGIHLDLRKFGEPTERITLKGTNSLQAGAIIKVSMIGGFAVTENVPKEFFEKWMYDNRYHPGVVNGLIFHHKQLASVVDMGKEIEGDIISGLDPMDPNKKVIDPKTGKVMLETRNDND